MIQPWAIKIFIHGKCSPSACWFMSKKIFQSSLNSIQFKIANIAKPEPFSSRVEQFRRINKTPDLRSWKGLFKAIQSESLHVIIANRWRSDFLIKFTRRSEQRARFSRQNKNLIRSNYFNHESRKGFLKFHFVAILSCLQIKLKLYNASCIFKSKAR